MADELDPAVERQLRETAEAVARAQRALDGGGPRGVPAAWTHLESAVARLRAIAVDDEVPARVRRIAEQWRTRLASHLLAASDLEAAGVGALTVVRLLSRATTIDTGRQLVDVS